MKYIIDKEKHPLYLQLYHFLRDDIVGEVYPYGTKLPSKRSLAEETELSTVTVEHALALLCDEGYAEARERSGFIVTFRKSDGFASPERAAADFPRPQSEHPEYPGFPLSVLSKTMRKALSEHGEITLERSPALGCTALREAIRLYLKRNRGIEADISQIVIGAGSESLYGRIIELLGRDLVYAIEAPSYKMIERVYKIAQVQYESLPLTDCGIDSTALTNSNADVLHTTPYRSFPSGVTASASKRHEYVAFAEKAGRYIIEDDFESEFSVSTKPTETLFALTEKDNVIYLNTFSKTISPSLRIGYMVLPRHLAVPYEKKLGFYSCTVPTFMQYVLAELIMSGDFERHINRTRRFIRKKLTKNEQENIK